MMAIDILESGEINTNRKQDLDLLMKIRNGGFQLEYNRFDGIFYELIADYEERLKKATQKSILPDNPDMEKVGAFVEYINRRAIEGEY